MTVDPERWRRVEEIFLAALDLAPDARARFLDERCAGDAELRAEVASLLADGSGGLTGPDFIRRIIDDAAPPAVPPPASGAEPDPGSGDPNVGLEIGPWILRERIGTGGMSTVYLGERTDREFEKKVAVKLIRHGMDSEPIVRRFRNERRLLASLNHPNIAQLIDGGALPDGRPFLIMEYVDGTTLDAHCRERRLGLAERLELFRTVCAAVHFAHQNLVIHRDLKPGNILVDREGRVKLLDFGIARLMDEDTASTGDATVTLMRMMTPRYASPEQVEGRRLTIATDIYSLGVVLYQLLTGTPPYRVEGLAPEQVDRIITKEMPPPPSSVPEHGELKGDLDTIVMKALRKEPERRYASAVEFAEDLRRYRTGLPVIARPDTIGYRTSKFVRRNRPAIAAGVIVFLSLVGGIVAATTQSRRARAAQQTAEKERAQAVEISSFLTDLLTAADPVEMQSGKEFTVREVLEDAESRMASELGGQPDVAANLYRIIGESYRNLGNSERAMRSLRTSIALARSVHGPNHPDVVLSMINLSDLLETTGAADSASVMAREALAACETGDLGPALHARALQRVASAEAIKGNYDEAERLGREAIEEHRRAPDRDDFAYASDLSTLGVLLTRQGKPAEAVPLHEEALAIVERLKGPDDTRYGRIANNLGWSWSRLEKYDKAEIWFRRALTTYEGILPDGNMTVLIARANLAGMLGKLGRVAEAESMFVEVIRGMKATFGERNSNAAHAVNNLALLYFDHQDYEKALARYREALSIYEEDSGPGHPWSALTRSNIAHCLLRMGRLDEAEAECRRALALRRKALRPDHPDIAVSTDLLGEILLERNRAAEARPLLEEALAIRAGGLSPGHTSTARTQVLLGDCLDRLGEHAAAESLLTAGFDAFQADPAPPGPLDRRAAALLERMAEERGDEESARRYAEAAGR